MTAFARLHGRTVKFPDITTVDYVRGESAINLVVLYKGTGDGIDSVGFIHLGEGEFVTVGDEPLLGPAVS